MADINTMLDTFSESIPYLDKLITGCGYVFGIAFILSGIVSMGEMSDKHKKSNVKAGWLHPFAHFLAGAALLYLPSFVDSLTVTFFGSDSLLSYSSQVTETMQTNTTYIVKQILMMAGLFWVVHGLTLFTYSTKVDPNDEKREGKRAWLYLLGGLLALNFDYTIEILQGTAQAFVTAAHQLYPIQQTVASL